MYIKICAYSLRSEHTIKISIYTLRFAYIYLRFMYFRHKVKHHRWIDYRAFKRRPKMAANRTNSLPKHMPLETARHPGRKCTGHERSRSWYLVSIQLVTSFYLFSGKVEYPNKIIRFKTSIVRMKMNPCEEIRRR